MWPSNKDIPLFIRVLVIMNHRLDYNISSLYFCSALLPFLFLCCFVSLYFCHNFPEWNKLRLILSCACMTDRMCIARVKMMLHVYKNIYYVKQWRISLCVSWTITFSTVIVMLCLFSTSMCTHQVDTLMTLSCLYGSTGLCKPLAKVMQKPRFLTLTSR